MIPTRQCKPNIFHGETSMKNIFQIETIVDQLKTISQIEHTRHRSTTNFIVNLIAVLIAYTWQAKKPSL